MDECPIKEMEIKFQCVMDTENSLFEPVPARKVKPEWYKNLPVYADNYGVENETIKKCPAMHDWLSMGYLIRNRHTIYVWMGHGETGEPLSISLPLKDDITKQQIKKLKSLDTAKDINDYVKSHGLVQSELLGLSKGMPIGGHPAMQTQGSSWDDKMCFKFKMDFLIETPKGTSCYYLDPFLFDNPYFQTWQGIIDTDAFNQITTNNILIFYPKVDKSFFITKGTPLVQIVPFVRYPWRMNVEYLSNEDIQNRWSTESDDLEEINARDKLDKRKQKPIYRRNWSSRKEYS